MRRQAQGKQIAVKLIVGAACAALLIPATSAIVAAKRRAMASESPPAPRPAARPVRVAAAQPARPAATPAATPTPARETPATLSGLTIRREMQIPHWLGPGQFAWDDHGVPPGEAIIVINIRARVLSVFRGGIEIGRSSLIYGATTKPTPHGTFPILEKDADHHSNLYDAPMPHMLRLTWDGVSIHGSAELSDDVATHGCVGVPNEFARRLFGVVRVGDRVIVWDGEKDKAA